MFLSIPPPPPQKPITIWVHGTRASSILPFLPAQQMLDDSLPPKGSRALHELDIQSKAYIFLKTLSKTDPDQFPEEAIYSFGWSGSLNSGARKEAAIELFEFVERLVLLYKQTYDTVPPITLIAHSHGGNTVLYMALLEGRDFSFQIQRVILLATPVQKETAHLTSHSLFASVYSLHSHMDMIQIMDPQRLHPYKQAFATWQETKSLNAIKDAYFISLSHPFFSERHFPATDNIIQADIYWKSLMIQKSEKENKGATKIESWFLEMTNRIMNQKRGILHNEFVTPEFITHLPSIIKQLDDQKYSNGPIVADVKIVI